MIRKTNGKYRFCSDFRKENKITQKDLYPIPIMSEILDASRSARYMSKIDLRSECHQIPLDEESKPIKALIVPGEGCIPAPDGQNNNTKNHRYFATSMKL